MPARLPAAALRCAAHACAPPRMPRPSPAAERRLALPCPAPPCRVVQQPFILTEPPLNTPENREYTAEIM